MAKQKFGSKDELVGNKIYNYYWKVFDFRGNKTFEQIQNEHPYCKDPVKACNPLFMMFHLGDAYFFFNEISKAQATSSAENKIFEEYLQSKRRREKRYGRFIVGTFMVPFLFACTFYRGYAWKAVSLYFVVTSINAVYDMGVYVHFMIHGPNAMRKVLALDPSTNFSSI